MRRIVRRLVDDTYAAVAPTVAVTLFALIAAGGIAFDYARMAAMDSELQNAADQAALAAASQLDGQSGACARASAAAVALVANSTKFANESSSRAVTVSSEPACDATGDIQFFQTYDQAADTFGAAATTDAQARIVMVRVSPRVARYALTPIVAAFNSGNIRAEAVASLGSSICKVPPLMMCNPREGTDNDFTIANYVTKGLKLVQGGGGSWAPGNFGFLDHAGGSNGDTGLREDLGWNVPPGECQPGNGVDTKPGVNAVDSALNSRFDIYDNQACVGSGSCPPSVNVVKDVVRDPASTGGNACKIHNQGWHEIASGRYLPTSGSTPLDPSITPNAMGHPRDMCHAVSLAGTCTNGRVGDGAWDRDAYFRTNYVRTSIGNGGQAIGTRWTAAEWQANTGLSPSVAVTAANYASRWNVYNWEIANRGTMVDGVRVLARRTALTPDAAEGAPVCSAGQGYGTGAVPSATQIDRRKLVIAVVNCTAQSVNGNSTNVQVQKWIDSFLVEPSMDRARTEKKEVYVEVIGETVAGGGNTVAPIRRDVPYLLR